jgi:hypothetical protein
MDAVRDIVFELANNKSFGDEEGLPVQVLSIDGGDDLLEIIFSSKPTLAPVKFVNSVKGVTSRKLLQKFPDMGLGERFWESPVMGFSVPADDRVLVTSHRHCNISVSDVEISFRCRQRRMAEDDLEGPDIPSAVQKRRCVTVPKNVCGGPLRQPSSLHVAVELEAITARFYPRPLAADRPDRGEKKVRLRPPLLPPFQQHR